MTQRSRPVHRLLAHRRLAHLLLLGGLAVGVAACGSDDDVSTADGPDPTEAPAVTEAPATGDTRAGEGTVTVRLEEVTGIFSEGFEIGLRFETENGEVIATTLWSDFVAGIDGAGGPDHYTAVLEQPVPSGVVVIEGEANIGIGPPPEVPDLEGELRCRLEVEVGEGAVVDVEIAFSEEDCLTQL